MFDAKDEKWFVNHYYCEECDTEWEDEWSCTCDDECSVCGNRDISPYKSEEIIEPF